MCIWTWLPDVRFSLDMGRPVTEHSPISLLHCSSLCSFVLAFINDGIFFLEASSWIILHCKTGCVSCWSCLNATVRAPLSFTACLSSFASVVETSVYAFTFVVVSPFVIFAYTWSPSVVGWDVTSWCGKERLKCFPVAQQLFAESIFVWLSTVETSSTGCPPNCFDVLNSAWNHETSVLPHCNTCIFPEFLLLRCLWYVSDILFLYAHCSLSCCCMTKFRVAMLWDWLPAFFQSLLTIQQSAWMLFQYCPSHHSWF